MDRGATKKEFGAGDKSCFTPGKCVIHAEWGGGGGGIQF